MINNPVISICIPAYNRPAELFSIDTIDNYYLYGGPTPWRQMLENSGEFNWPMLIKVG